MAVTRVAILGASGYGAAELLRRLLPDPGVEVLRLASRDDVGRTVAEVHPSLGAFGAELRIEDLEPEEAARGADLVFLGLPHRVSMKVVPRLWPLGVRIIDLSGDFRLRDPGCYARYYGEEHTAVELIPHFAYGLPELDRAPIAPARAVASPGCFATSQILALLPLARRGWLRGAVQVVAITGSSGSGTRPSAGTHHPLRAVDLRPYRPLSHQHTPEIEQALASAGALDLGLHFVPVSAPLSRGILATAHVELPAGISGDAVAEAFHACYAGEPFVRVVTDRSPRVAAVKGSQYAEVGFAVQGRRAVCFCALDNLVKGGAGQAFQSFNLMVGREETRGLLDPPAWP